VYNYSISSGVRSERCKLRFVVLGWVMLSYLRLGWLTLG
jgi:hypothetical protein